MLIEWEDFWGSDVKAKEKNELEVYVYSQINKILISIL